MNSKRDSLQIILHILKLLNSGPTTITRVVYGTNLNHESAQRYLYLLEKRGLSETMVFEGERLFSITRKGEQVMRDLKKAVDQLWPPIEGLS